MNAGVSFAQQNQAFQLRPGIALSAAQVAQLTGDIVWLVTQTVTLPDGSVTQALVPQVYVANLRPGDLDGSGALLSGKTVNINVSGDLNNSGSIGISTLAYVDNKLSDIKLIANNGNYSFDSLTTDERVAVGFAFEAAVGGGTKAAAKLTSDIKAIVENAAYKAELDKQQELATIANNTSRDGGLADPSRGMSATGPWKSVAELTPAQANALLEKSLPQGATIGGSGSADAANLLITQKTPNYQPSYMPSTQIVEFSSPTPTQYVRVSGGNSQPTANWIMKAEDIVGLTPAQIASKFSLPAVPTQIGSVNIPAGTKLQASVANGILKGDNPGGGGVQFYIPSPPSELTFKSWFSSVKELK